MKGFFVGLMAKWKLVSAVLLKAGLWGAGAAALLDTSSIPLPMDLLVGGWVWNAPGKAFLFCLMASVGSAIGGLVPYGLGRAGGELFLLKRIDREKFERIRAKFERQEFLAMMIPSMLPPPTPWKAFVFAAGVFEMRAVPFMLSVFCGRMLRWGILSVLVIKLGPDAVTLVAHHAPAVAGGVFGLALAGFGVWWLRRRKTANEVDEAMV